MTLETLERHLKQKLKDNPQLLLPNAHNVYIDERKYTEYLFGGIDERGLNKGRLITNLLGYGLHNYRQFDKVVKRAVTEFPAALKRQDSRGAAYEVITVITGLIGRKAKVVIAAFVDLTNARVTTVYIKEVKESDFA